LWEADSALVSPGASPCGGVTLGGALVQLLPDEIAANEARDDGRRTALSPRGGFFAGGLIHIYYDVNVVGPGVFDVETLGTGHCTTTGPTAPCARDATLLFAADRGWPVHGVAGADGFVHLLGCTHPAAFEDLCGAARVPADRAADASAYEYFSWIQGWQRDARQFTVAFENAGAITPSYDAAGESWLVFTADIFSSTISRRTSPQPWDGWSAPASILTVEPPPDWFISGGREHAALRSGDGHVFAFTYGNPTLHFVTVRID
jgi:hypothetical protein